MALTRANVEKILVKRTGKLLEKAGMAVTYAGANDDLSDPIGWALRQSGYSVADVTNPADSDLSGVTDVDKLLDYAEYRTLESILGNLTAVDVKLGPRAENLSQLATQIGRRLEALARKIAATYDQPTLEAGIITYNFAAHLEVGQDG